MDKSTSKTHNWLLISTNADDESQSNITRASLCQVKKLAYRKIQNLTYILSGQEARSIRIHQMISLMKQQHSFYWLTKKEQKFLVTEEIRRHREDELIPATTKQMPIEYSFLSRDE